MSLIIKRYGNRKLYDTQASRYVTLDAIAELVRTGQDLQIVDNDTGEDLTAVTFAQIIFEEQKRKNGLLGLPLLRWIIQQGGATVQEILTSVDRGREALETVRELAEKRVKQLAESAGVQTVARRGTPAPARKAQAAHAPAPSTGRRLFDEILELPQRQLEQLQHRIDAQVRASFDRITAHPAVQKELRRIEHSIKGLELQISRLRHGTTAIPRRPRGRPAKKAGR